MPARLPHLPKYRHYKPKHLAVVRIDGKDHYLGKYNSDEGKEKYRRLIAELVSSPVPVGTPAHQPAGISDLSVNELLVLYWDRHVSTYYVKGARPTSEQDNIRQALRFVRQLYGHFDAEDFSPMALKAVRQAMIEAGRCRDLINKDICRIRGLFRWAVEHELVRLTVHQALMTVAGLRKGRTEAREKPPVGPVPDELIERTLPLLPPDVATMVRLHRLTGMRPQEVVLMRAVDIDASDPSCWVYRPARHKGEHHGRERIVFLGRRAQDLLRPYVEPDEAGY
jgi:integrase